MIEPQSGDGRPSTARSLEDALRGTAMLSSATLLSVAIGSAILVSARAADSFYLGTWKFDSAIVAPWADPHNKPDVTEKNSLLGKTVTIAPNAISGPKVFTCKGPHYKLTDYTADLLFQGAFGEMHDSDKSKDPQKLALAVGLTSMPVKTLETGCELDWHFVNQSTAEIGLNDYVYNLKKQ
jgi:hypothetical protein